jgi:hypothetical protein
MMVDDRVSDVSGMDRKRKAAIAAVSWMVVSTIFARLRGYRLGLRTVVRCRQGHLFTTIWIPGVSVKAVRLGWRRFQHCPVGPHWSLVAPVKHRDLTEAQRRDARAHRDVRIP